MSNLGEEDYTRLPAFYKPLLNTISATNTLVTVVAVWAIVAYSPPTMAVYKWFLLNLAVGAFIDSW